MADEPHYLLSGAAEAELRFKNSRFIGHAEPCADAAQAQALLARLRREHPKANHHVFAWRILDEPSGLLTHRFDDDGEPGGTAGRPVLLALETQQIVNAAIVVVRYFGGIKLGAGGLVRAYAATAAEALRAAGKRVIERTARLEVRADFAELGAIERWAERARVTICDRVFSPQAGLTLEVPLARLDEAVAQVRDLTGGRAAIRVI
jgi:uncharacterized YigZ family protein